MRVLVTAATRHGATLEIAQTVAAGLSARGIPADALPLEEAVGVDAYDAVVLGSAVYMRRWLRSSRARGHRVFGGRLDIARLDLGELSGARALHARADDYRNWSVIEAYAAEIATALLAERSAPG